MAFVSFRNFRKRWFNLIGVRSSRFTRPCYLYLAVILMNILYTLYANIDLIRKASLIVELTPAPTTSETVEHNLSSWRFLSVPENEEERKFYKLRTHIIHPFNYGFIINGSNICDKNTTMVILIHSHIDNIDKRRAIRKTWGALATGSPWPDRRPVNGKVKIGFVFGQGPNWTEALRAEDALEGGIIQGDFFDSYRNLTLKSLLDLKWVVEFCPQVTYVVKADDDMFINVPYLLDVLNSKAPLRRTIIGPYILGARPRRAGKWKIGNKSFPFPNYPIYETGAAYVFTADIVGELFEAAKYVPQISIDDVYITGILGRTLGLYHALLSGFARYGDQNASVCSILMDKVITIHRVYGEKLINVWFDMHHTKQEKCDVSIHFDLLYIYLMRTDQFIDCSMFVYTFID